MNKCLIRVDGNSVIGTGHQMRCLAIAEELQKVCEVVFVVADEENIGILGESNYRVIVLSGQWNNLEIELDAFENVIKQEAAQVLLIDSYQVTEYYLQSIKKHIKTIYIDDLYEYLYPCDMLVNYAVYAQDYDYKERYSQTGTKLLLGCEYVPLRNTFAEIPNKHIGEEIENVLVLTGGTDVYHFALNFVKCIALEQKWSKIQFHIICGKYNSDIEELKCLVVDAQNIHIHQNILGLSKFMQGADIAISAGGTTLYELSACGTPTIGYLLADNQLGNLSAFSEKGYMISVGDIRDDFPTEKINEGIKVLSDPLLRKTTQDKMKKLVDGNGAKRLADEIVKLMLEGPNYTCKNPITVDDFQ